MQTMQETMPGDGPVQATQEPMPGHMWLPQVKVQEGILKPGFKLSDSCSIKVAGEVGEEAPQTFPGPTRPG